MKKSQTLIILVMMLQLGCSSNLKEVKDKNSSDIQPPVLLNKINLNYPEQARIDGLQGRVGLFVCVDTVGNVRDIRIKSPSDYRLLDEAAVKYVSQFKFRPARIKGKNISIWLTYTIDFSLDDSGSTFNIDRWLGQTSAYLSGEISFSERHSLYAEKEILNLYQNFIDFNAAQPDTNYNRELSTILDQKTNEKWQIYYDQWPLTFILYADLLRRFPSLELKEQIFNLMINQISHDLKQAAIISGKNDGKSQYLTDFAAALSDFLKTDDPGRIPQNLQSDLKKILQK